LRAHINLGGVLVALGKPEKAIYHYSEAFDFEKAHNNLGIALIHKGKIEEAVFHFREALRIKPGDAGAMNNLKKGMALQRTD